MRCVLKIHGKVGVSSVPATFESPELIAHFCVFSAVLQPNAAAESIWLCPAVMGTILNSSQT